MTGIIGAGAISPLSNLISTGSQLYRQRTIIRVPSPGGEMLRTRLSDIDRVRLEVQDDVLVLSVPVATKSASWFPQRRNRETRILTGEDAVRAASALLPRINRGGGSAEQIQSAVGLIEEASDPTELFKRVAREHEVRSARRFGNPNRRNALKRVPVATRLALEMASHEESERRALEGELHLLEDAWKEADEIAAIADDMFLPASMDEELERLKAARGADATRIAPSSGDREPEAT
jgi:hypothetical protein